MKRRHFLQTLTLGGGSTLATIALARGGAAAAPGGVTVQWWGHTCFQVQGGGLNLLTNPFLPGGCTAGYTAPAPKVDLVLVSSRLLDEGYVDNLTNRPQVLYQPGDYQVKGLRFQSVSLAHERDPQFYNRRFAPNLAWNWQQGGLRLLHLGGAGQAVDIEQKILVGRPDVLFIPVGGGDRVQKAYTPAQAIAAIRALRPRLVIPGHYRTAAADAQTCDLMSIDEFVRLAKEAKFPVQTLGSNTTKIQPSQVKGETPIIQVLAAPKGGRTPKPASP